MTTRYAVLSVAAHTIADVYEVTTSPDLPATFTDRLDRLIVRGSRAHAPRNTSVDLPPTSPPVFPGPSGPRGSTRDSHPALTTHGRVPVA
mgnify:CR=1 FL=1